MKKILSNLFFALTYPMTLIKSLFWMGGLAFILWAVPIWYTEKNPERYLMGDFERWEVWWAIIGPLLAAAITLGLRYRAKKIRERRNTEQHLKNS